MKTACTIVCVLLLLIGSVLAIAALCDLGSALSAGEKHPGAKPALVRPNPTGMQTLEEAAARFEKEAASAASWLLAKIAFAEFAGGMVCLGVGMVCGYVGQRWEQPMQAPERSARTMTPAESRQYAQAVRPKRAYNETHIGIPRELSGAPAAPSRESDAAADALADAIRKRDRS